MTPRWSLAFTSWEVRPAPDHLAFDKTVQAVNALALSGGSAFGLAAVDGVTADFRADGRCFEAAGHRVPIVPAAIIFDLASGGATGWDENSYPTLGRTAYSARGPELELGSVRVDTGGITAGLKGGLASVLAILRSGAIVGALVAVNAVGQATVGEGPHFWAAPFEQHNEFGGLGTAPGPAPAPQTKLDSPANTTIAVIATDLALAKADVQRMATAAHDGIARAVVPARSPLDGDLVFVAATGLREVAGQDQFRLGHAAATCLARAITRTVYHGWPAAGDVFPTWQERLG